MQEYCIPSTYLKTWSKQKQGRLADLNPVRADVKDAHHATNKIPDGFEVQTADTPGSINQQDDISLGCGFTLSICE